MKEGIYLNLFKSKNIVISLIVIIIISVIFTMLAYLLYHNITELIIVELSKNIMNISITSVMLQDLMDKIKYSIILGFFVMILLVSTVVIKLLDMRSEALEKDYLTGLYSKRFHEHHLSSCIVNAKLTNKSLSVIMIDVDKFKEINDHFGHPIGDRVLKSVSQIIKMNLRSVDICSRYGGDEFIIILPNTNQDQAALIGERIREKISNQEIFIDSIETIHASLSFGIAELDYKMSAEKLTECADRAMYISKNKGKNAITIFKEQKLVIC